VGETSQRHTLTGNEQSTPSAAGDGPPTLATPWTPVLWLLPAVAVLFALLDVGDLAYLVRAGDIMVRQGEVLRHDTFTFTVAGQPWLNQQWGAAVVFALVHRAGGWPGLVLLRALLVAVGVGGTYLRARRAVGADIVAAGATLACLLVAMGLPGALALRSQLLAVPLFVAAAALLDARRSHPAWIYGLIPIGVVWANVHGSFPLLPLLVALAVLGDLLEGRTIARLAAVGLVTMLTPLASPWGLDIYGYVAGLGVNPTVRSVVDEWLPLVRHPFPFVAFIVVNGVFIWLVIRRRSRVRVDLVVGLAVFGLLSVWIGRNILWWSLYAAPAYAELLAGWRPGSAWSRRASLVVTGALCVLLALGVVRVASTDPPEHLLANAPSGTVAAVRSLDRARVFAARSVGWLELEAPRARYFVDPRVELFPDAVWSDYLDVVHANPDWEEILDRWGVDAVVVADRQARLLGSLRGSASWEQVLRDPEGSVFVRA